MDGLNYGLKMGYISASSEAPKGTASAAITLINFDIVCQVCLLIFRSLSVHRFQKITFNKDYQKGLQGLLVNYHLTFPVIKRQIIWIL